MQNILLSPYSQIFYNEWMLNPDRSDYNIVFDQTINGALKVKQFKLAIERFVSDHLLLNSHVQVKIEKEFYTRDNKQLFWVNNKNSSRIFNSV